MYQRLSKFKAAELPKLYTVIALLIIGALSACGGGGVGYAPISVVTPPIPVVIPPVSSALPAASSVQNLCASPRSGTSDKVGSFDTEKSYLRSFTDETYLWYRDVPVLNPLSYANPQAYFKDLKTPLKTASGKLVDEFHWSVTQAEYDQQNAGISEDYGIQWAFANNRPPRSLVVANVEKISPAFGLFKRGDQMQTVDGADFVNGSAVDVLNEGLFPTKLAPHTFGVLRQGQLLSITITPATVITTPVQYTQIVDTLSGKVGYIYFDDHIAKSEPLLIDAFNTIKAQGATDLVLDLRYNGGGLLYIASQVAYMVAGSESTKSKTFDRLTYNDKRIKDNVAIPFYDFTSGNAGTGAQTLPSLGLKKVTILTTHGTASASEAIINGLRGVDVDVTLIGDITRGKPYGFVPQPNCGFVYYSIQFQGQNNKGFGDFADGFAPSCNVKDDFTHALGDVAEGQLAAALQYRATKICPTAVVGSISGSLKSAGSDVVYQLYRSPAKELSIPTLIHRN